MSDTKEKILQAADELFGRLGYDAATTREIAERCQVNKALIHYHFKNKEGLLASVRKTGRDVAGSAFGRGEPAGEDVDPGGFLR
jgi:AcrR family transcriptional regulator